jgi:glutamate-ammonia-ligase adenylyltransferase
LRELREKQFREKTSSGTFNAKFSPGALVDLEYDVQILQVMYGMDIPVLRTPKLHKALESLEKSNVLSSEEGRKLSEAYDFFRRLINGLRMLRGSGEDLFLPESDTDEYEHLARRMGYSKQEGMEPGRQLYLDFETYSAEIRAFVERHFGRDSLPGPSVGNVADLILSSGVPLELRNRILAKAGFSDPDRAYVNLNYLAGDEKIKDLFAKLAVLAFDILRHEPDPDMALNNWERFIRTLGNAYNHYSLLLSQPTRAEILLSLFSASQFLSDILIRNPEFLDFITDPRHIHSGYSKDSIAKELKELSDSLQDHTEWLNAIRHLRHREILRIGTRDICLHLPIQEIISDLSVLAEAFIQCALDRAWEEADQQGKITDQIRDLPDSFCIMALGKLGGKELNYSSDIDLMGLFDLSLIQKNSAETCKSLISEIMEQVSSDLSVHTEKGYVYRVDLRLRPYGTSGPLVHSTDALINYYRDSASLWEIQALLKIRSVAGSLDTGNRFKESVLPFIAKGHPLDTITASIDKMRKEAIKQHVKASKDEIDVKTGQGGIRDIEFLVQGLQLAYGAAHPEILGENTLDGLVSLGRSGIIQEETARQLSDDYIFLRKVEHYLQIMEDRQTHTVPEDAEQRKALGKRMMGTETDESLFTEKLEEIMERISRIYASFLEGNVI